uniref:RBD domain-containing protein n=2 Tax=Caenorhabditis japonica TaxID=281687 RepID=A0A8R1IEN5_CAEJA
MQKNVWEPTNITPTQDQASPMASPSTPQYPKHSDSLHSLSGGAGPNASGEREAPKFKYKMIMVHLPFDQHSRVEVRPCETARDAISKLLKKRNITPQLCHVNSSSDPKQEIIDLS